MTQTVTSLIAFFAVPWDAFVAAFLFYAVLTLVVLGGADVSSPLLAAAYLAIPVAYVMLLVRRAARVVAHAAIPAAGDTALLLH